MYRQGLKPIPPDAVMEREYYTRALEAIERNEEDPRLKAYFDEIGNCIEQKDYVSALEYAEKLVTSRGEAKDWSVKGYCLSRLERYYEALECLDKAIKIDSNYAMAWAHKGNVLDSLKRYNEALAFLDRALELDANDQWAWTLRGYVLSNLERYEEALVSYDRAIELDANDQCAWPFRGIVLNNLKRYDEALVSFDRAIKLDPTDKWYWGMRGEVLDNLKRYSVTGFIASDVNLTNSTLSGFTGSGTTYNFTVTPNASGAVTVNVPAATATDIAGNNNTAATQLTRTADITAPTVALTSTDTTTVNAAFSVTATFSEDVTGFDNTDITVANANVGNFVSVNPKTYTFDVTPNADGNVTVDVLAAKATDTAGNNNTPGTQLTRTADLTALTANFGAIPNITTAGGTSQTLTVTFSDSSGVDVSSLDNSDVIINWEEALASYDRAIELGDRSSYAFFNRAIAILGLNRWDEGIAALDDAFQRLEPGDEAYAEDADLIIRNLFINTHNLALSQTRITSLIAVYEKHKSLSILGNGIVRNIPALMSEMVSDKAARTWLDLWEKPTSNYEEFKIPIRLLDAAVRYKETKGDRRVLLKLPIEEGNLLEPLVSTKPE